MIYASSPHIQTNDVTEAVIQIICAKPHVQIHDVVVRHVQEKWNKVHLNFSTSGSGFSSNICEYYKVYIFPFPVFDKYYSSSFKVLKSLFIDSIELVKSALSSCSFHNLYLAKVNHFCTVLSTRILTPFSEQIGSKVSKDLTKRSIGNGKYQ